MGDKSTKNSRYGLVGAKLGHSFSPLLHAQFASYDYSLMEIPGEDIDEFFKKADFAGVNVTIPYKEKAMRYCRADENAMAIGCVNTLVNSPEGVTGYNTDTYGFEYMAKRAGISFGGKTVVILGSGGTCRTAAYTAARLGASQITVVSRNPKNMGLSLACPVRYVSYDDRFDDCEILVNTTPVGMYPEIKGLPIDISNGYVNLKAVIDVIYNPLTTRLTYSAKKRGIVSTCGLPMLVAQGFFASKLFKGKKLGADPVGELKDADKEKIEDAISFIARTGGNIVLIGMPGSGKSTVGKLLAEKTGLKFVDTDEIFEKDNGISPSKCIKEQGESAFRALEKKAVESAASKGRRVIATGGGVVLDAENIEMLALNGTIVYLHRQLSELATLGRPLSKGRENLKALYFERLPIYLSNADVTVIVKDGAAKTADEVIAGLRDPDKKRLRILVVNGPNLNMLGIREPGLYGRKTYADLMKLCRKKAEELDVDVDFFQSNHEGDLVDIIQQSYGTTDGIVINPGAYTHTSVALLDALKSVGIPTIEVHITDVDSREEFRRISYIRSAALHTIAGHGLDGYTEAMEMLTQRLRGPDL